MWVIAIFFFFIITYKKCNFLSTEESKGYLAKFLILLLTWVVNLRGARNKAHLSTVCTCLN